MSSKTVAPPDPPKNGKRANRVRTRPIWGYGCGHLLGPFLDREAIPDAATFLVRFWIALAIRPHASCVHLHAFACLRELVPVIAKGALEENKVLASGAESGCRAGRAGCEHLTFDIWIFDLCCRSPWFLKSWEEPDNFLLLFVDV